MRRSRIVLMSTMDQWGQANCRNVMSIRYTHVCECVRACVCVSCRPQARTKNAIRTEIYVYTARCEHVTSDQCDVTLHVARSWAARYWNLSRSRVTYIIIFIVYTQLSLHRKCHLMWAINSSSSPCETQLASQRRSYMQRIVDIVRSIKLGRHTISDSIIQ